mgnify:FL=1
MVEGPDASGKQTQTARIVEWLRNSGQSEISEHKEEDLIQKMPGNYPSPETEEKVDDSIKDGVWHLSFPTYGQTPGGRVVSAYLSGRLGSHSELSMEDKVDIYAADRKQFRILIENYLENGGIIVCDRYREANLIHQLVEFEGDMWEKKYEYIKNVDADLPDADEVFYLDISPQETIDRMVEKDKDMVEADESYMRKSNLNGRKVAKKESWTVIDGERDRDSIEADLKERIKQIL